MFVIIYLTLLLAFAHPLYLTHILYNFSKIQICLKFLKIQFTNLLGYRSKQQKRFFPPSLFLSHFHFPLGQPPPIIATSDSSDNPLQLQQQQWPNPSSPIAAMSGDNGQSNRRKEEKKKHGKVLFHKKSDELPLQENKPPVKEK